MAEIPGSVDGDVRVHYIVTNWCVGVYCCTFQALFDVQKHHIIHEGRRIEGEHAGDCATSVEMDMRPYS